MNHVCTEHLICNLDHQPSINRLLWELGHFDRLTADGFSDWRPAYEEIDTLNEHTERVKDAIASWQSFRPLTVDGDFGERSHLASVEELPNRCGCPDILQARRGGIAEWPEACQLAVTAACDLGTLRTDFDDDGSVRIEHAWQEALSRWNAVCGVKLLYAEMDEYPRISATVGKMGSGTLAWSYLADGDCGSRLRQEYNRAITWNWHKAVNVMAHELGHALGLPHTNKPGNLMLPFYSPSHDGLGEWDIDQVNAKRYGPPAKPPEPDPDPPINPPQPEPTGKLLVNLELLIGDDPGGTLKVTFPDGVTDERDLPVRAGSLLNTQPIKLVAPKE